MTDTSTRAVMDGYLDALLHGSDFGRFFAPDVVWTTMETGRRSVVATRSANSSWRSTRRRSVRGPRWSIW